MKLDCTRCNEPFHRITDESDPHDEFDGVEYRPLCTKCYFAVFRRGETNAAIFTEVENGVILTRQDGSIEIFLPQFIAPVAIEQPQ